MKLCCEPLAKSSLVYGPGRNDPFKKDRWQFYACYYNDQDLMNYDLDDEELEIEEEWWEFISHCPFCGSKLPLPEKYWLVKSIPLNCPCILPESRIMGGYLKVKEVDLTPEEAKLLGFGGESP